MKKCLFIHTIISRYIISLKAFGGLPYTCGIIATLKLINFITLLKDREHVHMSRAK